MRRTTMLLVAAVMPLLPPAARAQTSADSAAVVNAALDYIEGWYEGKPERMERALHPDLAKRIVQADAATHESRLGHMGKEDLVRMTGMRSEGGEVDMRDDVTILDIFGNAAVVRVDADRWVDFLQIAKWNGQWLIVNVLWEMRGG